MDALYIIILLISIVLLISNGINESFLKIYNKIPIQIKLIPIIYFVIVPYTSIPISSYSKYNSIINDNDISINDDERSLLTKANVIHSSIVNNDNIHLFIRQYPSATKAVKGNVLLIHGFSLHSYYFQPLALVLSQAGYNVISYDQTGCGRSGSIDGFRGHVDSVTSLIDEMNVVLDFQLNNITNKKLYLFAESMGATVAIKAITSGLIKHNVNGIILSGAVIKVAEHLLPPPPALAFIKMMASTFPKLPVPSENPVKTFHEAFGDQELAQRAANDPLVNFQAPTFGLAKTILTTISDNVDSLKKITVPILILTGDQDKRTDHSNSKFLHDEISSKDKTLKIIKGGNHQLLQDTKDITKTTIDSIKSWLLKH